MAALHFFSWHFSAPVHRSHHVWFHLIKPLLLVDELTPLAATNLEANRSECQ